MFNFAQGTTTSNPFWNKVRDFLSEPTQEEMDCQAPKPILLNTGAFYFPLIFSFLSSLLFFIFFAVVYGALIVLCDNIFFDLQATS
jgi:hypothetical protein